MAHLRAIEMHHLVGMMQKEKKMIISSFFSFLETYMSGAPRRVDWATLAESVTIKHFRSEDFPIGEDSAAIWAV